MVGLMLTAILAGCGLFEFNVKDKDSGAADDSVPGQSETDDPEGYSDADGDALTFEWTQTQGPTVTLSGQDTDSLHFTAPEVGGDVVLGFELVAKDAALSSAPAHVEVLVHDSGDGAPKKPSVCGCTSGSELAPLMGVLLLARGLSRRRKS